MTLISNHSSLGLRIGVAALAACFCAIGQAYNFVNWTISSNVASGSVGALGIATVSTPTPGVTVNPWSIQFNSVTFTPTLTNGLGITNPSTTATLWSYDINLAGLSDSNGVIVGVGNFGHGQGYPGYRLRAYDSSNLLISLSGIGVIGSYDHSWPSTSDQFNDNLALNLWNGDFTATVISGHNDQNSDILFFQLPTGVARLEVFTRELSHGDTVNVVMATRDAVPEPFTMSLLAAGVGVAIRKRRARQNR